MRIGIDVTRLAEKYRTGVQNYYYGLVAGLASWIEEDNPVDCWLVDRLGFGVDQDLLELGGRIKLRQAVIPHILPKFADRTSSPKPLGLWNRAARKIERMVAVQRGTVKRLLEDFDVFHVWTWDVEVAPYAKHVITFHDLIPIVFSHLTPAHFTRATQTGLQFARNHADRIIADSQFTKEELIRVAALPTEKIVVIYPGVRQVFHPLNNPDHLKGIRAKYGIYDRPYVLTVGFLDPRKNVQGHVRAFEKLGKEQEMRDLQLVMVGPESPATSQVLAEIASAKVRDRIHVTGYVPDDDLVALMNGAQVFVYCSVYEGFGFPVLEAMACGTPVVTSITTSLGEISQDAAILVDPANHEEIAIGIARLLTDDALRETMQARGLEHAKQFTWRKCAQEHLRVYQECYRSGNGDGSASAFHVLK
jgi:glycosyltransferase involved in cell wall biosynthesis